jgi:hypothetical protein
VPGVQAPASPPLPEPEPLLEVERDVLEAELARDIEFERDSDPLLDPLLELELPLELDPALDAELEDEPELDPLAEPEPSLIVAS